MRIDIVSENRIGISQDILTILSGANINLIATEVQRFHTFVHMEIDKTRFDQIKTQLMNISGVKKVDEIELLPAENRQKHLNVLMQRLPDPTFDIDNQGNILLATTSAAQICELKIEELEGKNLKDFIVEPIEKLFTNEFFTTEINLLNKPYQADITPVLSKGKLNGAILVLRSPQRIGQQISALQLGNEANIKDIVGQSDPIKSVMEKCIRFGRLDLPVLISGETGTGKELLAKSLHQQCFDHEAPFLAINCATLPENLLESELFGYAPGAFSGAQRGGKPGLFELAAGGSVFLDEIGEMSTYLQAKLLRFLQDYTFRRVGGTKEIKVKVRLISATHRDLEHMAEENKFREDLFYRLNVLNIEIPPLRQRADDIPLLVEHFITRAATQIDMKKPQISAEAMTKLCQFSWPGNVRQLENLLFRTIALLDGDRLNADDIQLPKSKDNPDASPQFSESPLTITDWHSAQQAFETQLLNQLYPQYPSTRKLATRLKVSHNKIAMKLKQYGIVG